MKWLWLTICMGCVCLGFGQKHTYQSAEEVFNEAVQLYSEEQYDRAFVKFMSINYNDTAYFDAQFKAIHCASVQNHHDTVLTIANDALKIRKRNPYSELFMNAKGHALNNMNRYEEALEVFNKALDEHPMSYLLYYNKAISLHKLDKVNEAIVALQNSITYNPRYYASHLKLAKICAEAGEYTRAALCLNMVLMLESANADVAGYIGVLEKIYEGSIELKETKLIFAEEEDFSEIDLLIKNKVASNKSYKVKTDLQYAFIRSNNLMLEKLIYDASSNGFWNQNYVRFFKWIYDSKNFNNYSNYNCVTFENTSVQNVVKKNLSKIKIFLDQGIKKMIEYFDDRMILVNGVYTENKMHHYGGYGFGSIGTKVDGKYVGKYVEYSANGFISAEGEFDQNGSLTGAWKYYDAKGNLEILSNFEEGKLKGRRTTYYQNGNKKISFNVENNKIIGEKESYYNYGKLYSTITMDALGENGPVKYYNNLGGVSHSFDLVNGLIDGRYQEYYNNGQLRMETTYKLGKQNGNYKSYYYNGAPYATGQYVNDLMTGHWKYLHANGTLKEEGETKEGLRIGVWKTFEDDGTIVEENDYGASGKKTGIYREYDQDGKISLELVYKGNDIESYKTFDKDGVLLSESQRKGKNLDFITYYSKGVVNTQGAFFKDHRSGVWKQYNQYGVVTKEYEYDENGALTGTYKEYFDNGKIESFYTYKAGMLEGPYEEYYRNGQLYFQGWYVADDPVGEWIGYNRDGSVRRTQYYLEGVLHGEIQHFDEKGYLEEVSNYYYGNYIGGYNFDTLGQILSRNVLIEGEGKEEWTDEAGKLFSVVPYKGAKSHGKCVYYYGNGQISSEGIRFSGDDEGFWKYYHRNGQISSQGIYKQDEKDSIWTWYDETGKVTNVEEYKDGEQHGKDLAYYSNGKLESELFYKNGERHGESKYYSQDGDLQVIRYYHYGVFLGYSYLDNAGKVKPMIPYAKDQKIEAYFSNGKPSHISTFKDGYSQGLTQYFHSNGKLAEERYYENGRQHGDLKIYSNTGVLLLHEFYQDGDLEGVREEYHNNGKLKSREQYVLDKKYGWCEYYDESGKLIEKIFYHDDREYEK